MNGVILLGVVIPSRVRVDVIVHARFALMVVVFAAPARQRQCHGKKKIAYRCLHGSYSRI